MSVILPADHHATFAGWEARKPQASGRGKPWSSRRRAGFLVFSAIISWALILSPFYFLG